MTNRTKKVSVIYMAVFSVLAIWLPTILLKIPYCRPDDDLMNYISNGSFAGNTTNLIYPNLFYGIPISMLYKITPALNWYCIVYLILLSVDVFVLIWTAHKLNSKAGMICAVFIGLALPLFLTFTVVAYMCIGAGMALAVCLSYTKYRGGAGYAAAAALMVIGYMIRGNTFVSAAMLFVPMLLMIAVESKAPVRRLVMLAVSACILGLVLYICTKSPHKYRPVWMWAALLAAVISGSVIGIKAGVYRELIITFAVVCIAVIGLGFAENMILDAGWSDFRMYTSARAGVLDYPHAKYDDVQDQMTQLGITRAGNNLLFDWVFVDKAVFSTDTLRKLRQVFTANNQGVSWKRIITDYKNIACVLVPTAAAAIFAIRSDKKRRLLIFLSLLILGAFYLALILRSRFVFRVVVPLCMISIAQMYLVSGAGSGEGINKPVLILAVTAVGALTVGTQYAYLIKHPERASEAGKAVKQYVLQHTDERFIVRSNIYNDMYFTEKPAFFIGTERVFDNTVKSGSGDSFSPRYYDQMKQWNISDPDRLLMELLADGTLRYVDYDADDIRTYLEEQSGAAVNIEIDESFGDKVFVYRFSGGQ